MSGYLYFPNNSIRHKRQYVKIFLLVCSVFSVLTNTYTTALTTKQVVRKVVFPPCLIEHIPLSQIKMTYIKKTLE